MGKNERQTEGEEREGRQGRRNISKVKKRKRGMETYTDTEGI